MRTQLTKFVAGAAVCLAAGATRGPKPIFLDFKREIGNAKIVAEARILDVTGGKGRGMLVAGRVIRVRITENPEKIYRGFAFLGDELKLAGPRWGQGMCGVDLASRVDADEKLTLLLVINDKDQIHIVGEPVTGDDGLRGYRVWSYCDFNAAIIHHGDDALKLKVSQPLEKRPAEFEGPVCVRIGGMLDLLWKHRREALAPLPRILLDRAHALSERELKQLLFDLGAGDRVRADAAQQRLVRDGADRVPWLQKAMQRNHAESVRGRLREVLAAQADSVRAHALADRYRAAGRDAVTGMLVEVAPRCEEPRVRRLAYSHLRAAAGTHGIDAEDDASLVAAIRARLGR